MPRVGFDRMTPVLEQAKTVHALDRAVTITGHIVISVMWKYPFYDVCDTNYKFSVNNYTNFTYEYNVYRTKGRRERGNLVYIVTDNCSSVRYKQHEHSHFHVHWSYCLLSANSTDTLNMAFPFARDKSHGLWSEFCGERAWKWVSRRKQHSRMGGGIEGMAEECWWWPLQHVSQFHFIPSVWTSHWLSLYAVEYLDDR
jgi:hypothetical protein